MKKTLLATLTATALTSLFVQATNYPAGTVTFNGSVSGTTCSIAVGGVNTTAGVTVVLDPVTPGSFSGAGSISPPKSFTLDVTNCSGITGGALRLNFSGPTDQARANAFANTASTGAATGVAVVLGEGPVMPGMNWTGLVLAANTDSATQYSPGPGGNISIPMHAGLLQTAAAIPTAGAVLANTTLNIVY